jgi:glycine oxidase
MPQKPTSELHNQSICVLGAGVLGLLSAYSLSQRGYKVSLHDPAPTFPPRNASYLAGGMLAPYSEIEHMDAQWIKAGLHSTDLWGDMPLDTGFHRNGSLLLAHGQDRYILERFKAHLPAPLQKTRPPQELEPQIGSQFKSALHLPGEAHLEPRRAMHTLCEHLQNQGVRFVHEAAEPDALDADIIVDCRGMGTQYPELRGVKGETALVHNREFTLDRPVRIMHPRYPLYIIPRPDHHFMIGATIIESEDNTDVSLRSGMELMSALYSLDPSFGEAKLIEFSAGIRPSYPDNLPRIKRHGNKIFSLNGTFRHGWLLAPVMVEALGDAIECKEHKYWTLFHDKNTDQTDNQWAA